MPVGALKTPVNVKYSENFPVLKYWQHDHSTCIFTIIYCGFGVSRKSVAEYDIVKRIDEPLNLIKTACLARIRFAKYVMTDKAWKKVTHILKNSFKQWNNIRKFDILNNISEYITLVQLKYFIVNVNHSVSVVGDWIVYSNFENILTLNEVSLDLIVYCADDKDAISEFEEVFYVVRFINPKAKK